MMKKFFAVLLISFTVLSLNGQSVFKQGDIGINAGIGLGWGYGYGYTGISTLAPIPSFNVSGEYGTFDIPEVGVVSLGGFASFRSTWDRGTTSVYGYNYDYDYTYRNSIIAARGVFHFGFFDTGGFDLYAGVHTGFRLSNYSYTIDYGGAFDDFNDSDNDVDFIHDVFAGGRYYMSESFGFFAEVGYGISYLKAGITLKF